MQLKAFAFRPAAASPPIVLPHRSRVALVLFDLIDSYVLQGDLAAGAVASGWMRTCCRQTISVLARWILTRKAVRFMWRTQAFLPPFQFDKPRPTQNRTIEDCARQIGDLVDEEAFAGWFVNPSRWLDLRMPVDLLLNDPDAVVHAARKTRVELMRCRLAA